MPLKVTFDDVKHATPFSVLNVEVLVYDDAELVLPETQSLRGGPLTPGKGLRRGEAPVTGAGDESVSCPDAPPTTATYPAFKTPELPPR